jgi:hypothetical protein
LKKIAIILFLTISLLFSFASLASAELLFGVTAETGSLDFSTTYKGAYTAIPNVSETPNMLTVTGDFNLFLLHIGLEYGTADVGHGSTFTTGTVKAGWEFGLPILKAQLYGGYQMYGLTHGSQITLGDSAYGSLIAGLGVESSIADFTFYGNTYFPLWTKYSDGISANDDDHADLSYLKVGVSYAPIPFVDLFVDYRKMEAESKVMKLDADGYSFGVKLSF